MEGRFRCTLYSNNVTYHVPDPCMFCRATFGTSSTAFQTLVLDEIVMVPSKQQGDQERLDTVREKLLSIIDTKGTAEIEKVPTGLRGTPNSWAAFPSDSTADVRWNVSRGGFRNGDGTEFAYNFRSQNSGENVARAGFVPRNEAKGSDSVQESHGSYGHWSVFSPEKGGFVRQAACEKVDLKEKVEQYCRCCLNGALDFLQMASESPCYCLFAVYRLVKLYALYALVEGNTVQWKRLKEENCPLRHQVLRLLELFSALKVDLNLGTCCEFDTPLMTAVATGDEDVVRRLLEGGADPSIGSGREEVSSLGLAILLDNGAMVNLLLEHGASAINLCTKTLTPLRLSFDRSRWVAQALMQHGARLQELEEVEHPLSALGHAVSSGNTYLTQLLLRFGADVNQACGSLAPSFLHLAVGRGDLPTVELLQRYGVRSACSAAASTGTTPLGLALNLALQPHLASATDTRCAATFLQIFRALLRNDSERTLPSRVTSMDGAFPPLHVACYFGHLPAINLLLKAELVHLQELRALLSRPDEVSRSCDHTPLRSACPGCAKVKEADGHKLTLDNLGANALDLKSLHLSEFEKEGLRVFINQECQQVTPIMQLASRGHQEALGYLLDLGADPLHFGERGSLVHCAVSGGASQQLLHACLDACQGANISRADALGNTPLHLASRAGGGPCQVLCERGARLNPKDRGGETPLSSSIYFGVGDATQVLLEHGADPDIPDKTGATPIYWAIFNNRMSSVKLLLEAGCHMTQKLLRSYPANLTLMRQSENRQHLVDYVHQPRTLMHLCRHAIRRRVSEVTGGCSIQQSVSALPIPNILQDYVMLRQLAPPAVPQA